MNPFTKRLTPESTRGEIARALCSELTRYDMRVSARERIPNIHRLPLLLQAVDDFEADTGGSIFGALRGAFIFNAYWSTSKPEFDLPPVQRVWEKIR